MKAVKVRTSKQVYNSFIRKHFTVPRSYLVSDPTSSLRTGDVVRIASGWHVSKLIRHVVTEILAPYGTPVEERPRVMSEEERVRKLEEKRERKLERRRVRKEREREGLGEGEEGGGVVVEVGGAKASRARTRKHGVRAGAVIKELARENVRKAGGREGKVVRNEAEAERLQSELDEKGLGVEDVEPRLKGLGI